MIKTNKKNNFILFICICTILFAVAVKISPEFLYKKGISYVNAKDYVKAYFYIGKAHRINPKNKDYRYYYALTLSNLNPTEKVQKEIFNLIGFDDSASQLAERCIYEWKSNITDNIGDNYIEQTPYSQGILRWDTKTFPLKVAIVDENDVSIPPYYKTEILRAFAQWQGSTKFLKFAITNNPKAAQILVKIEPAPTDLCSGNICKYVVGYTEPTVKGSKLELMTITLYNRDPRGNYFSDKELYNTVLHEIGHAIGIMGHSYSSGDLMYMATDTNNYYEPYRSSFQYLSSKDINTVKLLYKLIPSITNTPLNELDTKGLIYAPIIIGNSKEISSRKLLEAENYIRKAPELSGGYIDLAIAYAELNKNKEALNAMEKALSFAKSDSEKYIALYNLAALNLNLGYFDNSLSFANDAKNINNSEEINELIVNINNALKSDSKKSKKKKVL